MARHVPSLPGAGVILSTRSTPGTRTETIRTETETSLEGSLAKAEGKRTTGVHAGLAGHAIKFLTAPGSTAWRIFPSTTKTTGSEGQKGQETKETSQGHKCHKR